ncbi:CAF1-domain-containing protein, partial [Backusella circina FSU 941]
APSVNFRAIIEMIQMAQCPVVLHNGAYDLCHTVDQFWRYLPNEVIEFKKLINGMWGQILDTKYLAEYHPKLKGQFKSSALGTLYEQLKKAEVKMEFAEGFDRYKDDDKAHEAAYDAYMTGVIYVALIVKIKKNEDGKGDRSVLIERTNSEPVASDSSAATRIGQKRKKDAEEEDEEEKEKKKKTKVEESTKNESSSSDEVKITNISNTAFMSGSITLHYGNIYLMRCAALYLNVKEKEAIETKPISHSSQAKQPIHSLPKIRPIHYPPSARPIHYPPSARPIHYPPTTRPIPPSPHKSYVRNAPPPNAWGGYRANMYYGWQ